MRHLGYALIALVCSLSVAVAAPKKKGADKKAPKAPAGQKTPPPAPAKPPQDPKGFVQPDPADQAELDKVEKEYQAANTAKNNALAVKLAKKLLEMQIKATGALSMQVEWRRIALASAYYSAGDTKGAEKTYREHVKAQSDKYGAESKQVLDAYQQLMSTMWGPDRVEEREGIQAHVMAVTKKVFGENSPEYARIMSDLASTLQSKGEWGASLRAYEDVLKIYEKIGKADDWSLISALQMVAMTYWQMDQKTKAIPYYDRLLKVVEAATSQTMQARVATMWGVASMYQFGGRKDLAGPLLKKVIGMIESELVVLEKKDPDDWQISGLLSMLGSVYRFSFDFDKAEAAYKRYDAWFKKKNYPGGGATMMLAELARARGNNKEALRLYEQGAAEMAKQMPDMKVAFNLMLTEIYREMGDYKKAIQLFEEYKKYAAKTMASYPSAMAGIDLLGVNYYAGAGRFKEAETALDRSMDLAEKDLQNILRVGTDTDHAIYFSKQMHTLDTPLNFNLNYQPKSGNAARIALTTVLRRKGRLLDAAAAALATIRAQLSPEDKKMLDELNVLRAELAKKTVAGPSGGDTAAFGKELAQLEDKIQRLEGAIAKKSAAYRTVTQPIELAAVQKAIPKDARLIEIVNYQPYDKTYTYAQAIQGNFKNRPRRYLAYVASTKGDPTFVDLGDAGPIDKAIEAYRKALADPDNDGIVDLGKALNDLTFAKIAPQLGGATNILMAPDGALNVIPFSALVDDKKEFLIKKYTFTYLTSGRDLLRLQTKTKSQGGGVLFADPKFDDTGKAEVKKGDTKTRGTRSMDLASLQWPQLPGTAAEADAIVKTFKGLKVYRGDAATEGTIKKIKGPKILHLATHGFFLPDDEKPPEEAPGGPSMPMPVPGMGSTGAAQAMYENPLLRSGLAFSGANKLASGDDDGLLTALEASGLNLWGTKLVVLSACETGVGKVTNGDGVYGLRRSLVIAGAESLVMSMWQVDDFATKELMTGFYKRLGEGKPRSEALRATQLELLAKPKYAHPFYWAAFLPAGATTPLKD